MTKRERRALRKVYELIDRLKDENSPTHFDSDSTPYSAFEWALERMSDELGETFPEVVDEMNAECAAECFALADEVSSYPIEPVTFVSANTTFRQGTKILHKGDIEKMLAKLKQSRPDPDCPDCFGTGELRTHTSPYPTDHYAPGADYVSEDCPCGARAALGKV